MTAEELTIIMNALVQMGESGKEAFIWYVVMKYGLPSITILVVFSVIALFGFLGVRYFVRTCDEEAKKARGE